jgi:4-hydroxybenzoate polyprenyltransferase
MYKLLEYAKLLRIKHWLKNGLIFLALIFSGKLFDYQLILKCFLGFLSFSFIASAVYIFNDIKDVDNDKKHPIKKNRPIASGKISIGKAYIVLVFLVVIGVFINALWINSVSGLITLEIYLMINILYSAALKKLPLVDVCILVFGFVIRAYYGAFIVDVAISKWLYLTVMMGSFFMAFGKRRNELELSKSSTREVLSFYNKDFLDKFMYVSLVLTVVFYSLWSIDADTLMRIGNDYLIYTIPLVFVIIMKYCLNVEVDSYGDPVDVITSDKVLMFLMALLACMMVLIIYVL